MIVHPFRHTTEPKALRPTDTARANHIVDRVLSLSPEMAEEQLASVLENFDGRHRNLLAAFVLRTAGLKEIFATHLAFTKVQQELIGAYFMHEYSFEAAALFNPSIVPHPDQSGTAEGNLRFILSLRAVGEGHVSSLNFRCGTVNPAGQVTVAPTVRLATVPKVTKRLPGPDGDIVEVTFLAVEDISERVIFPITPSQSNGIEDARFVLFEDGDERIYRATYTAYSGTAIRSELIETSDFLSFTMTPLRGPAAQNKGMALFPCKFDGKYAMITRQDNENLYLSHSANLYHWGSGKLLLGPKYPWEFVQIGTCGAPIELDEGWLLLTHGVGAMRRYSIGAVLLDKDDPSKIIARSREPLVHPEQSEREGYVPNVVYTCGAMRHGDRIILPYAISDTYSNFATIKIAELIKAMESA